MFTQFFGNYLIKNSLITKNQFEEIITHQKTVRVKLGLIAVSKKLLTPGKADEINRLQASMDKRFGDIAIERGYLNKVQLDHLLSLQGNPYLLFAQTIVEKGYMSLEEVETYVLQYQRDNNFSDSDLEAIKNGDVDKIIPIFINIQAPLYNDHIALAIRNIIRFIDTDVYFEKAYPVSDLSFQHLAGQMMEGQYKIFLGFSGDNSTLLSIANPFAKETFSDVDEDAYDSVCEFINCINGLFASKLSHQDIEVDMLPPIFYKSKKLVSNIPFYIVPIYISGRKLELILSVNTDFEIK